MRNYLLFSIFIQSCANCVSCQSFGAPLMLFLYFLCYVETIPPPSLADHFKPTFISQDGWKLLLIPFPCNCQADIFLMGLHSTITRTPLLNEKPVTKWRRRTLADPILRKLTLDSGKVRVLACGFQNSASFWRTNCGTPEFTSRLFGLPTRQPNSGLTSLSCAS